MHAIRVEVKAGLWSGEGQCCDDALSIADLAAVWTGSHVTWKSRQALAVPGLAMGCGLAATRKEKGQHGEKAHQSRMFEGETNARQTPY